MIANTGTYVDSPFHRYENGKDLAELPLESVAELNCLVVRVPPRMTSVDEVPLAAAKVKGRAVLFHTSWDRHFRTDAYFEGHPHLTARAAEWLVKAGAALVGIRFAQHRQHVHGRTSGAHHSARPRDPHL